MTNLRINLLIKRERRIIEHADVNVGDLPEEALLDVATTIANEQLLWETTAEMIDDAEIVGVDAYANPNARTVDVGLPSYREIQVQNDFYYQTLAEMATMIDRYIENTPDRLKTNKETFSRGYLRGVMEMANAARRALEIPQIVNAKGAIDDQGTRP